MQTVYPFRRVTAIISTLIITATTLCINQGLRAALPTADQELGSLLFVDLLHFVMDNDKDEPKFSNMRFGMD